MNARTAVPDYIGQRDGVYDGCAPGHRFQLFFPAWSDDWTLRDGTKASALEACRPLSESMRDLSGALRRRQRVMAEQSGDSCCFPAEAVAPFATGLGHEHPVENGFAFLLPYGLPYLAGSGVKGVMRRAAEELALFGDPSTGADVLDLLDVWMLFGFEGENGLLDGDRQPEAMRDALGRACERLKGRSELADYLRHAGAKITDEQCRDTQVLIERLLQREFRRGLATRGALTFLDVHPEIPREGLVVEVMTPHHGEYYRGESTPHDAGQPIPIPFLAIPARSCFEFHVTCDTSRLAPALSQRWRDAVVALFQHAFDWLGFGAKTAVGYGQMALDYKSVERRKKEALAQSAAREREAKLAAELSDLPEDAAWVERQRADGAFDTKDQLLKTLDDWLYDQPKLSPQAWEKVRVLLETQNGWKGITSNPDAVQGKRKKPKYPSRGASLARHLQSIKP